MKFAESLDDVSKMMGQMSEMTQELLTKLNPAHSMAKSEKSEKHISTKQDIELQRVISGMIEEQKYHNPEKGRAF